MAAGFFLGRIVEDDRNDLALRDKRAARRMTAPQSCHRLGVEGATKEHIES